MNELERLKVRLANAFKWAHFSLDVPGDKEGGTWWLDVGDRTRHVAVEWRPRRNRKEFGVSLVTEETGIGEGPDEWLAEEATVQRIEELFRADA